MARPLRGILFGLGHMGRHHAKRLSERTDVQLKVVDPAKGLPAPAVIDADFAVVATPSRTHVEVAEPLLQAGIPTLVEKPLADSVASAEALAHHKNLCVGHVERWNPAIQAVSHVRPRFLEVERLRPWPSPDAPGGRGTDTDVIYDLMLHDIDLALRFLEGDIADLRAIGSGVVTKQPDIVKARLEIGTGVADLTASRVSRRPTRTLRLFEDGFYWSVDLLTKSVTRVCWGHGTLDGERVPVPSSDALMAQHDAFLHAIRTGAPMPVDGPTALRGLQVADAIRGALTGASAGVPPVPSGPKPIDQ